MKSGNGKDYSTVDLWMHFDVLFVVFIKVSIDNNKNIGWTLRTDGVLILIIIFGIIFSRILSYMFFTFFGLYRSSLRCGLFFTLYILMYITYITHIFTVYILSFY